ncbi:hypothetical protein M885DRAFT_47310 [Pelagophyceae sp. CCMP2097]|nr:hypothetical protein M885DRAFT_47310 [Pelagophyceae sp. CCMP2097]
MAAPMLAYERLRLPAAWVQEHSKLAFTVDGVLSADECAAMVQRATEVGWRPSPMAPLQLGERSRFDDALLSQLIFERLRPYLPPVHRKCGLRAITPTFRFIKYGVGAEVNPHPDTSGGDKHTPVCDPCSSMFTCLLYLNEGYIGCATHLLPSPGTLPPAESAWPEVCERHGVAAVPRLGRAFVFEHDILHACPPLLQGGSTDEKLVCRVDVCYDEVDIDGNPAPNPFRDSTLTTPGKRAFSKLAKSLKQGGPSLAERVKAQLALDAAAPARPRARFAASGFEDGVAIVTGASAGIGAALCEAFLRDLGVGVVVGVARRADRLDALAARLSADGRGNFVPVVADVTAAGAAALVLDAAVAHSRGGPFILVNNAGLARADATVLSRGASVSGQQACEATFACNVMAPVAMTREFVRRCEAVKAKAAHILNVSSLSAHRHPGGNALGVYAASKAALKALSEATRRELREARLPYRVSCLSPGLVESEFYAAMHADRPKAADLIYATTDSLDVADVVDAALYVLSAPDSVEIADVMFRTRDSLN